MFKLLCAAVGGAMGAVARCGISAWVQSVGPETFPFGTFCVNTIGSLLIGVMFGISECVPLSLETRLPVAIGFLGAFTTFSTYSLETLSLFRDRQVMQGFVNIGLNNSLSLLFVFRAYALSRSVVASIK